MGEQTNNAMLINQIELGSTEAFDELYERYYSFVMQICLSVVHDYMEAEELCHDVFLEIIQKASMYHASRGTVEAWIAVIAKSRSKDLLRKKIRRATIFQQYCEELQLVNEDVPAETAAIKNYEITQLHDAVKQLPENQKRVLLDTYFTNKTHHECAAYWRIPLGTVKSWIRYGLKNLRKQFQQYELHDT